MAYRQEGVDIHREMGLRVIREEKQESESYSKRMFLEGDYDMYLFGKMG